MKKIIILIIALFFTCAFAQAKNLKINYVCIDMKAISSNITYTFNTGQTYTKGLSASVVSGQIYNVFDIKIPTGATSVRIDVKDSCTPVTSSSTITLWKVCNVNLEGPSGPIANGASIGIPKYQDKVEVYIEFTKKSGYSITKTLSSIFGNSTQE